MSAPGQVNSRNSVQDYYYLVISPKGENIHIDALRHTYLHFVLDPLIAQTGDGAAAAETSVGGSAESAHGGRLQA